MSVAPGVPYGAVSGTGSGTSQAITLTAGIAAGDLIFTCLRIGFDGTTCTGASDTSGLTWTVFNGANKYKGAACAWAQATTALPSGTTVTLTLSASESVTYQGFAVPCYGQPMAADVTAAAGSGTAVSSLSVPFTPAFADEIAVGVAMTSESSGVTTSWTLAEGNGTLGSWYYLPAETAQDFTVSMDPAAEVDAMVVTFRAGFPAVPLGLEVDLNLGVPGWTDISSYVYQREGTSPPVTITRGRADETAQATASACTMQWNNRDGRFSPLNPTGAYYGQLGRNTPLRVSVPAQDTYLRMEQDTTSYAWCPDSDSLQITSGTLSVRIDCDITDWYSNHVLVAKMGTTANAWGMWTNGDGTLEFAHYDSSATEHFAASVPVPWLGRIAVRADYDISAQTITWYYATTMSGTWTQLGDAVTTTATSLASGAGQFIQIGGGTTSDGTSLPGMYGQVYEVQVLASGTLKADPVFTSQTAGAMSFTDAQSNTWSLTGTAELSGRSYRGHFECSTLPQRWDPSGTDVWVPVQASGVLRRLQQGNSPVSSTFRRGVLSYTGTLVPVAYWPFEDAEGATQAASGLPGGVPGTFSVAEPAFTGSAGSAQADSVFACSASLPTFNGAVVHLPVPGYKSNGSIVVRFLMNFTDTPAANTNIIKIDTSGTASTIYLKWVTGNSLALTGSDSAGSSVFDTGPVSFTVDSTPSWWSIELTPDGSDVQAQLVQLMPGATAAYDLGSPPVFSGTAGNATQVTLNPFGSLSSTEFGQVTVQSDWVSMFSLAGQLNAYTGEYAGDRVQRLCSENNLACRIYGFSEVSVVMGAQQIDTLANILQSCEDADRGMLFEPAQVLGLGYRPSSSMLNQAGAANTLTLDYSSGELGLDSGDPGLQPVDDDQYLINDVTLTRNNGSSAQIQVTSGPLSIQAPPDGAGDYDTSLTTYNAWDADLPRIASWWTHVGTVNEERYPSIPLNLARSQLADLIYDIQDVQLGDMVIISNPPDWLPPGDISQLVYGVTENLGGFWYQITWNTVPESPYETAVASDSWYAAPPGSALTAGMTDDATTAYVGNGTGGMTGAFLDPGSMQVSTFTEALSQWTGYGLTSPSAARYYMADSTYTYDTNMQEIVAAGIKLCLTIRPAYDPVSATELSDLETLLSDLQAAGAVVDVCLWHEPYYEGLSIPQFQSMIAYYGPTVRQYYPLVFVSSVQSVENNSENDYFITGAFDKCAADFYAWDYIGDSYTLDLAATPANTATPPLPFGLWEFGTSTDPVVGQDEDDTRSYLDYVQGYMLARLAAGQPNADVLWFNAGEYNLLGTPSSENAGFEGGIGTWADGVYDATATDTSAEAHTGSDSCEIECTTAGNCGIGYSAGGTNGIAVTAGTTYTVAGWFLTASTARSVQAGVNWYDSSSYLSSSFPGSSTDSSSAWTQETETVTAPSDANYACPALQIESAALDEVHYTDDAIFAAQSADSTVIGFNFGSSPSSDWRISLLNDLVSALGTPGLWTTGSGLSIPVTVAGENMTVTGISGTSSPQTFTVTRSVNGVTKTQAAGAAVTLTSPPVAALTGAT